MVLRQRRSLALFLILVLVFSLGADGSWRGLASQFGLKAAQDLAAQRLLADVCFASHSGLALAPSAGPDSSQLAPKAPASDPEPLPHSHQHCADCLVRLAAALPPSRLIWTGWLPIPLNAPLVTVDAPPRAGPQGHAHGARAPPVALA